MNTFPLKIVTPEGLVYDGDAQRLIVRTGAGDLAVMARHVNCVASLGKGRATVVDAAGNRRHAACMGGFLLVRNGQATLVPTTFEWADAIEDAPAQRPTVHRHTASGK